MALASRDYLYSTDWDLRHRYDGPTSGYIHGSRHSHSFETGFLGCCDRWAGDQRTFGASYGGYGQIDWIGEVGVYANKPGMHSQYRAMDLTYVRYGMNYVDTNADWRGNTQQVRRYIGTVAACRRQVGTVLTCWYNTAHHDHVHMDNGVGAGPINTRAKSDTTLVQAAAVYMNGAAIGIDGVWGQATEDAYVGLLGAMNMKCLDPKTNASHATTFLFYIGATAFKNQAAGYYRWNCA